jgi:hypothetical protein
VANWLVLFFSEPATGKENGGNFTLMDEVILNGKEQKRLMVLNRAPEERPKGRDAAGGSRPRHADDRPPWATPGPKLFKRWEKPKTE